MAWTKSTSFGTDDKNQMLSRVRNPGWLKSRSAESTSAVNRPSWRKWSTVLHSVKKNYRYFTEFLEIIDMWHLSSSVSTYHMQGGGCFQKYHVARGSLTSVNQLSHGGGSLRNAKKCQFFKCPLIQIFLIFLVIREWRHNFLEIIWLASMYCCFT